MRYMALRPSSAARRPDRSGDLPLLMPAAFRNMVSSTIFPSGAPIG
jgi:hypothetical protein